MERRGIGASSAIYTQICSHSRRFARDYQEIAALCITLFQGGAIRIKRARLWYYGLAWRCNRSEVLSAHVLQA
jgi:hypothetical protein